MPVYSLSRRAPSADSDTTPRGAVQGTVAQAISYPMRGGLSSPELGNFPAGGQGGVLGRCSPPVLRRLFARPSRVGRQKKRRQPFRPAPFIREKTCFRALEGAVQGAHVDSAVHAVGIEGGAQAENAHEGDDGLQDEGHAAHVRKAEHHAAENHAHPVELGLHEDDGGTGHIGVFPGPDGGDGRDDQHDPQADAQGQIEAAGGVLLVVRGLAEEDELGEDRTEDDGAQREQEDGEEAGGAEHLAGNGVDDLHGNGHRTGKPCADAEHGSALEAAIGAEEQDGAGRLRYEPDAGSYAAEVPDAGAEGHGRSKGAEAPSAGAGSAVMGIFPPREEGEAGGELRENSKENKGPVGDHGKLPAKAVEWRAKLPERKAHLA